MRKENRLISPEELEKGDEVLYPVGASFIWVRLLRTPKLSKGGMIYGRVKVEVKSKRVIYNGGSYITTSLDEEDEFLEQKYLYLYKNMWLIKSAEDNII